MPGGVDFHRDFQHLQASGHGAARRILSLLHHPVLSCFTPFSGEVPADYHFDFLGTRIRHRFIAGFSQRWGARTVEYSCPTIDNEYFEWIDLLESVVAARGSYTMMELGAGFGRWAVRQCGHQPSEAASCSSVERPTGSPQFQQNRFDSATTGSTRIGTP